MLHFLNFGKKQYTANEILYQVKSKDHQIKIKLKNYQSPFIITNTAPDAPVPKLKAISGKFFNK